MFNLIKKDIIIQKKTYIFALVYGVFVFFMFNNPAFQESVYIMGSTAIAYMLILTANAHDDKCKAEVFLNSLPLKRQEIVRAKYLGVAIFVGIATSITGLAGGLMKAVGLPYVARYIGVFDVATCFASLALLTSIYYPLYFRFGASFVRIANIALFMIIFFAPSALLSYLKQNYSFDEVSGTLTSLNNLSLDTVALVLAAAMAILLLLSMVISQRIYGAKEF